MDLTPTRIAELLARDAERVAAMLLPGGKRVAGEWCAGSTGGDSGKSLKVRLEGDRAGRWADFATDADHGDLLDLWCAARNLSIGAALAEARAHLGLPAPEKFHGKREKQFETPAVPHCSKPAGDVLAWLTGTRKLTAQSIDVYKLASYGRRVLFPFLDPLGNRAMLKWRSIDDKQTAPTSSGQKPTLFGWQAVPDTVRKVSITEGELDAISLWIYGYPALSVPFGGGGGAKQSWIEHEHENLARFDEIYLVLDSDQPGQDATQEIIRRLGAHRCRIVTLPRKDANDCLKDGVPKSEIDAAYRRATTSDPEGLRSAGGYLEAAKAILFPDPDAPKDYIDLPWEKAHGKIRLRRRELVLVLGINGHGKTQLVDQFALTALRQGERAMVASLEYTPGDWLAKAIVQAAGLTQGGPTREYVDAIAKWMGDRLWLWGHTGTAKTERTLEVMEYCYRRYGCRLFVIDSLLKCGIAEDDYASQKAFVERLCDFKNAYDATILLVCHPRKQEDEHRTVGKMDVRGAGAITDLADTVLVIHRNKAKEEEAQAATAENRLMNAADSKKPDAFLVCSKQRRTGWEGSLGLWFHQVSTQFLEHETTRPFRFVNFQAAETQVNANA